jgi:type I restriction enzyme M protein
MEKLESFLQTLPDGGAHSETLTELRGGRTTFMQDAAAFHKALEEAATSWKSTARDNAGLRQSAEKLAPISEQSRDLVRQVDLLFKLMSRLIDICENELKAKGSEHWVSRETSSGRKALDESRKEAVEQLKKVHYFHKQAHWLHERFPEVEDEDFDFEEALRDIHVELQDLNTEAVELAGMIARNFEELGI